MLQTASPKSTTEPDVLKGKGVMTWMAHRLGFWMNYILKGLANKV